MLKVWGEQLSEFLAELAGQKTPFLSSASVSDTANAYKTAFLDRAKEIETSLRSKDELVWGNLWCPPDKSSYTVGNITVAKPYQVHAPAVPAALSSTAAATFTGITSRSVTLTNLTGHIYTLT